MSQSGSHGDADHNLRYPVRIRTRARRTIPKTGRVAAACPYKRSRCETSQFDHTNRGCNTQGVGKNNTSVSERSHLHVVSRRGGHEYTGFPQDSGLGYTPV